MHENFVIELSGRVAARSRSVTARRGTVAASTESVDAPRRSVPVGSITEVTDGFSDRTHAEEGFSQKTEVNHKERKDLKEKNHEAMDREIADSPCTFSSIPSFFVFFDFFVVMPFPFSIAVNPTW